MSSEPSKELQLVIQDSGLEQGKVENLLESFTGFFNTARKTVDSVKGISVTDETQVEEMDRARRARLQLKEIRVEADKLRKKLKEDSLREGKAIQGIYNVIEALIVPVEQHLEKQEKFAEEIQKKKEQEKLQERINELSKYVSDISVYDLVNISNETFQNLLENAKKAYWAQKDAELKAEEDRLAAEKKQKEEEERIRKENEVLRKQNEEKEKKLTEERRIAAEEKAEKEKELQKEREEKLKLEKEIQAKKDAEAKTKREEEERIAKEKADDEEAKRQAEMAPDKEKMRRIYQDIRNLIITIEDTSFSFPKTHTVAADTIKTLRTAMNNLAEEMKTL